MPSSSAIAGTFMVEMVIAAMSTPTSARLAPTRCFFAKCRPSSRRCFHEDIVPNPSPGLRPIPVSRASGLVTHRGSSFRETAWFRHHIEIASQLFRTLIVSNPPVNIRDTSGVLLVSNACPSDVCAAGGLFSAVRPPPLQEYGPPYMQGVGLSGCIIRGRAAPRVFGKRRCKAG